MGDTEIPKQSSPTFKEEMEHIDTVRGEDMPPHDQASEEAPIQIPGQRKYTDFIGKILSKIIPR